MKLIIAGCRNYHPSPDEIDRVIEKFNLQPTEIVCGMAAGVDIAGKAWAENNGTPVTKFPADWDRHGKAAGAIRNRIMAQYADELLAFWDGKSRGTKNMIEEMKRLQKNYTVVEI